MLDTLAEIQERHRAVKHLEASLVELHQIFLDMAVLVEAQVGLRAGGAEAGGTAARSGDPAWRSDWKGYGYPGTRRRDMRRLAWLH